MAVNLYDHQKKAVEQLRPGAVLCGGVGTGKSRTALAYFYTKICGGRVPRSGGSMYEAPAQNVPLYIITTAMKRDTLEWESELSNFGLSTVKKSPIDVVVDSWNNIKKYTSVKNAFFILDEQRVVGYGAWVKSFLKIAKSNRWILLTATPGDRWIDYAPIFIANGFYKNITEFRRKHVVYNTYLNFPKIDRYINTKELERHRRSVIINMSGDKYATPHHEWIKVGYSKEEYTNTLDSRWDFHKSQPIENASQLCYILRKIVNSDIRRLRAVQDVLKNHKKVIVFYNFDYELHNLRRFAETTGLTYSEWNGHKHEPIPETESWLYLVQYTAGAEGWNCVLTDTMIFYSQNYSYKTVVQAAGRIDRLNTPYADLYYYHLFSDAPIDRAIRAALKKKKVFNERAFADSLVVA